MLHKLNHGEIPRLLGYGSKMTNMYGRVLFSHLHRDPFVSFHPAHGETITLYIYIPESDSVVHSKLKSVSPHTVYITDYWCNAANHLKIMTIQHNNCKWLVW